jgi:hypothetical protein
MYANNWSVITYNNMQGDQKVCVHLIISVQKTRKKMAFTQYRVLLYRCVGPAKTRITHCSLPRLIVLNPGLVPPFISRGAQRQTA